MSPVLRSHPSDILHVAPKICVPRDQPVSGFSLQRIWGDSGSENPEYQPIRLTRTLLNTKKNANKEERGGGGVSSRNHEDHFSTSRVTKNKISFSRFLDTQKRNKVWNHLTIF